MIYDDGTLDFVPTGDSDAGFRDRVSGNALKKGTWYTSSWDGDFTAATNNILLGKTLYPASDLNSEGRFPDSFAVPFADLRHPSNDE